ncbi:MAG TPA: hypothetical protein VFE78_05500 [Gemmataceae bacterium]|jgi:hypothetical protein|nr:hypothetical protein [Gemmataceae bacterium]
MFPERLLPAPPAPAPAPGAFVLCPFCLPLVPAGYALWQQALYQWAFEQAQAVVRPSLPERDLLAVWN